MKILKSEEQKKDIIKKIKEEYEYVKQQQRVYRKNRRKLLIKRTALFVLLFIPCSTGIRELMLSMHASFISSIIVPYVVVGIITGFYAHNKVCVKRTCQQIPRNTFEEKNVNAPLQEFGKSLKKEFINMQTYGKSKKDSIKVVLKNANKAFESCMVKNCCYEQDLYKTICIDLEALDIEQKRAKEAFEDAKNLEKGDILPIEIENILSYYTSENEVDLEQNEQL